MYRFKSTIFSLAAITALVVVTADCKADATAIRRFIGSVDRERMSKHLFYLAKDPLPYRKLNLTLPGHEKNTLYEADDYLAGKLKTWGYHVEREGVQEHSQV